MTDKTARWLVHVFRLFGLLCLLQAWPAWSACDESVAGWRVAAAEASGVKLRRVDGLVADMVLPPAGTGWIRKDMVLRIASPQGADCKGGASRIVGGEASGRVAGLGGATSLVLQPQSGDGSAPDADRITLAVPELQRARLQGVRVGDLVKLRYSCAGGCPKGPDAQAELSDLQWQTEQPTGGMRGTAMAGSLALVFVLALVLTRRKPWQLMMGEDGRYSTSKFQMLLWFWVVVGAYLAFTALRVVSGGLAFLGGLEIPTNLLLLSGISALSFATAKAITVSKVEAAGARGSESKPSAEQSSLKDLVQDDQQRLALGDFQVVLLTVVAVAIYGGIVWQALGTIELRQVASLPDLDNTLLGLLGLGNAGYLGVKAASDPGSGITPQQAKLQAQELLEATRKLVPPMQTTAKQVSDAQNDLKSMSEQSAREGSKSALQIAVTEASRLASVAAVKAGTGPDSVAQISSAVGKLAQLQATWRQHAEAGPAVVAATEEARKLQQEATRLAQQMNETAAALAASATQLAEQLARQP